LGDARPHVLHRRAALCARVASGQCGSSVASAGAVAHVAPAERGRRGELAGEACRAPARAYPTLTTVGQRAEFAAYRTGALVGRALPLPVASFIGRTFQPALARVYRSRDDMTAMGRRHLRRVYG